MLVNQDFFFLYALVNGFQRQISIVIAWPLLYHHSPSHILLMAPYIGILSCCSSVIRVWDFNSLSLSLSNFLLSCRIPSLSNYNLHKPQLFFLVTGAFFGFPWYMSKVLQWSLPQFITQWKNFQDYCIPTSWKLDEQLHQIFYNASELKVFRSLGSSFS